MIVHADLKAVGCSLSRPCVSDATPQGNVLVSNEGLPLLSDFGLSRALPGCTTTIPTSTSLKGTLRWLAPELVSDDVATYTTETDVWAYGMTVLVSDL